MMRAAFVVAIVFSFAVSAFADGAGAPRKTQPTLHQGTMVCTPTSVRTNQSFTVQLPEKHGPDIAIVDPAGRYFFLSFRPTASAPKHIPPISDATLRAKKALVINTSQASGIELAIGSDAVLSKIFRRSGVYRVLISDTLETEDPVLDGWCEVFFER